MKKICMLIIVSFLIPIFLSSQEAIISAETYASYYGDAFHGRPTANGEIFDMTAYTAAHKTLPFGTLVEVTNLENGKKVIVRINDRGPFVGSREIDVSKAAASVLDMVTQGIVRVSLRKIDPKDLPLFSFPKPSQSQLDNTQKMTGETSKENNAVYPFNTPNEENKPLIYTPAKPEEGVILWRIQLGSFKREENAMRLVIQLRKAGFEPAYEKSDNYTRVVLHGIPSEDLEKVKKVLDDNSFNDYVLHQESW